MLEAVQGDDTRLVLVFASQSYDLDALVAAAAEVAGGAELAGCSTAGEIGPAGPSQQGVTVFALGGTGFSVTSASADTRSGARLREAAVEAAGCLERVEERDHRVLLMIGDGLAPDPQELVLGAYSVTGAAVPIVGGFSGDDLETGETFQIHGTSVLSAAVVAMAISSDAPIGIGVRHGLEQVGDPLLVTDASGSHLRELNDAPAREAYLERVRERDEEGSGPPLRSRMLSTAHPLGAARARGREAAIHVVRAAGAGEEGLRVSPPIGQGELASVMEARPASVLAATDAACAEALAGLGGAEPLGALAFDCVARRQVLGDDALAAEVERIAAGVGGAPLAGFYTYGELARTRGLTGFHNYTLVVMALA